MLEVHDLKAIRAYYMANQRILTDYPDIPASALNTYLGIILTVMGSKEQEPVTIKELATRLGLPYTTMSRHIRFMMVKPVQVGRKDGPGWVDTTINLLDRRERDVVLTPKGKRLAAQLVAILAGGDIGEEE
jgi:DNA-binding MarR family transcriptional regulator